MKRSTLNLGPFGIYLWGGIMLVGSLAVAGGAALTANPAGTIHTQQLANGTARVGQIVRAGACTDTATSTTTTDRQCWVDFPESGSLPSGTPGQVPTISAVTATGTVTATATQTSTGTGTVTYTLTSTGTVTTTATEYTAKSLPPDPLGTLYLIEFTNEGELKPMFTRWRAVELWSHITSRSLRQESGECSTGSDALIAAFNPDSIFGLLISAEARTVFPAGDWTAKLRAKVNANGAAIRIEVYLDDGEGPTPWFNWTTDVFSNTDYAVVTKTTTQSEKLTPYGYGSRIRQIKLYATCSTPTTVTIELNHPAEDSRIETPVLVDSVHYQDIIGMTGALADKANTIIGPEGKTACFYGDNPSNWTTTVTYCDREPVISGTPGQFVKFAGTGTSTTTSKEAANLVATGTPGQAVGYLGTGTVATTSIGPITVEPSLSGTPGKFVRFAGTGTATTTSKEAATVGVTARSFFLPAADFSHGSGATVDNVSAELLVWVLRDGQSDQIYGAGFTVPADYVSGLSITPIWYTTSTDANTSHTVRWTVGHQKFTANASPSFATTSWTGSACSYACSGWQLVNEAAQAFGSYAAGDNVAIYLRRQGVNAADTYTGSAALAGARISYTSSL